MQIKITQLSIHKIYGQDFLQLILFLSPKTIKKQAGSGLNLHNS